MPHSANDAWQPTRAAGLAQLDRFLPHAGLAYSTRRSFDSGPGDHAEVSALSPWISHRLVTEWEVIESVLQHHGLQDAGKFVQEVCWRTYWKGWLELRPQVWQDYRAELVGNLRLIEASAELRQTWENAVAGHTGIQCFDFWARELVDHGYLHNHARMWFASIWIFTLHLPWSLGADFFYRHLLDGDAASNTLSWRWVAGLQTEGKHYLARPENIARFSHAAIQQPSDLNTGAGPLENKAEDRAPRPLTISGGTVGGRFGLLLCDQDLGLDELPLADAVSVAACPLLARRSSIESGRRASSFSAGALQDALNRAVSCGVPRSDGPLTEVAEIVQWAQDQQFDQIVMAWPAVGPAREMADELKTRLADTRVSLVTIGRAWDRRAWPHATKGFFAFRRQIPGMLSAANIAHR